MLDPRLETLIIVSNFIEPNESCEKTAIIESLAFGNVSPGSAYTEAT